MGLRTKKGTGKLGTTTFKVVRDGALWDVYWVTILATDARTGQVGREDVFEDSFTTEPAAEAYVRCRLLDLKAKAASVPFMEDQDER